MLKAKTTTGRFKAPATTLQAYIGDIENLPDWATTFCLKLKKQGEDYKVTTPGGEIFFRIDSCGETGIVDMWGGPSKDMMMRWPARVTDDGTGGSVFAFTAIQSPGQSDGEFDGQCAALSEEFENIRHNIDGS